MIDNGTKSARAPSAAVANSHRRSGMIDLENKTAPAGNRGLTPTTSLKGR